MPVFRWGQSWNPIRDLEREVDRLLHGMQLTLQTRSARQFPPVNLREEADRYVITAEIPGVQLTDLELTAANGILTLKGVRNAPEEATDHSFRRQERFQGPWLRKLQLPDRILEDEMTADYSLGVLQVYLPKDSEESVRRIPVSDGATD